MNPSNLMTRLSDTKDKFFENFSLGILPELIEKQVEESITWRQSIYEEGEEITELRQEVVELRQAIRELLKKLEHPLSKRKIVPKTLERKKRVREIDPWKLIKQIGPIDPKRLDDFLNNF